MEIQFAPFVKMLVPNGSGRQSGSSMGLFLDEEEEAESENSRDLWLKRSLLPSAN